jgi:hypothetical protein
LVDEAFAFGVAAFGVAAFGVAAFGVAAFGVVAFAGVTFLGVAFAGVPFLGVALAGVTFLGVAFAGVAFLGVTLTTFPADDLLETGFLGDSFKGVSNICFMASVMGVVMLAAFFAPALGVLNNCFMAFMSGVAAAALGDFRVFFFAEEEVNGDTNVSRGTFGVLIESKSKDVLFMPGVP